MSFCKDCGAEIEWLCLPDGRNIPVDPEPEFVKVGEGAESFFDDELGEIKGRAAGPEEVQTVEQRLNAAFGFVPHWRTCPARRGMDEEGE
jgi:hypothetical protein